MAWARLIHTLLAAMVLVVAPWLAAAHTSPHAADEIAPAERSSCCGDDGSCCCGGDAELPPSCPCCPAPIAPKPTSPTTSAGIVASADTSARVARPRVHTQPTPRNLRRESVARADAHRDSRAAIQSWRVPITDVRLWTCVHQT